MDNISKTTGNFSGLFDAQSPVIDNALEGWVRANTGLVILAGHRTVLRRDYRLLSQVKILSGCWSGFEPMCSGFVGPGMLTGAVLGEKFSPPSYGSILAAIRELNSPHGVLVLVMNHPTLKVNFSLAVDIAARENIPVKLLYVCDDCSGHEDRFGRKGLAGAALIFKIAGAMAEKKQVLEYIHETCSNICSTSQLSTISIHILNEKNSNVFKSCDNVIMSLDDICGYDSCSLENVKKIILVKGDVTDSMTGVNTLIHKFVSIDDLTKILLGYVLDGSMSHHSVIMEPDKNLVLLFNNYGSVLNAELNAYAHDVTTEIESRNIGIERLYIGSVITSRTLGFSITVMEVTDDIIGCLDSPTEVSCWPANVLYKSSPLTPKLLPRYIRGQFSYTKNVEIKMLGPILSEKGTEKINRVLEYCTMALISCEEQINKMVLNYSTHNILYGTVIKAGAEAINKVMYDGKLHKNCPYALFQQLSVSASNNIGDVVGSYYAVFFEGVSQAFLQLFNQSDVTMAVWADALESGIKNIEFFANLKRGEKTMLDALYPALETMRKPPSTYAEIAEAAELGSIDTVDGSNKKHLLPDAGSHTVAVWVRAAVEALNTFESDEDVMHFCDDDDDDNYIDDDDDDTAVSISLI